MVGPRALAQQRSAFGHNILCHKLLEMGGFLPLRSPLEVLRLNMFFQLVLLAIGLMLVAFPRVLDGDPRQRHFRRLEELKNGADEAFFEERRALETYQPRGYWQTRVLGGLLIFIALSKVLFDK
jgi:hypothetical protein